MQSLYFLNLKFQACSHLLWLCSSVCVRPGQKPRRQVFSQQGSSDTPVDANGTSNSEEPLIKLLFKEQSDLGLTVCQNLSVGKFRIITGLVGVPFSLVDSSYYLNFYCRKTLSTFYNKAEVLYLYTSFYLYIELEPKSGRHHPLLTG